MSDRLDPDLMPPVPQVRVYPILETLVKRPGLAHPWCLVTDCCFQDLFEAHEGELAGMGLAIIGNLMKRVGAGTLTMRHESKLELVLVAGDTPIPCPWPGMPNDNPRFPLDFERLPWASAMFLNERGDFKKRMDRLHLMRRIQAIWVPWLIGKLQRFPGAWQPSIEKVEL